MRRLLVVVLVLTMFGGIGSVFAGGSQEDDGEIMIAFLFQDLETEFWVAGHKAITETLRDAGINVIERNANEDANRQLEQTRDVIAQGVDGIIIIPQDGESALTIIGEANDAGVPIAVFNRPPSSEEGEAIVVVANNEVIAEAAVEHMAQKAMELGRPVTPAIMVGDLGDPNAVGRRQGFMNVIDRYPELWTGPPIEIPTKWDSNTALANLQSGMQANPDIDFLFTSSDFLFPVIRSVLAPLGKWQMIGDPNHVILGGLDGDMTACELIDTGYLDATGVQNLFAEAEMALDAILSAIEEGETNPDVWLLDEGFALTADNYAERDMEMWGCVLRAEQ